MANREDQFPDSQHTYEADVEAPPRDIVVHGGTFESFRHRDFGLFWSGALVSNVGTWMQNVALAVVVYNLAKGWGALALGVLNFLTGIPVLVFGLFAGGLADRFDRKTLLIWAQSALLVQAAILGLLASFGRMTLPAVWVLVLAGGVFSALTFPSWQAMVPDLVPRESLLNAIALNAAQFNSARLLGAAIGGLVLVQLGAPNVFYLNAVSFLFVIWALWAIRPRAQARAERSADVPAWRNLLLGIAYAREHLRVGMFLLSTAMVAIFGMAYMILLEAISRQTLHSGDAGYAYLMTANGVGAVTGALIVASLPHAVRRDRLVRFGLLGMSLVLLAFSFARSLLVGLPLVCLAGAAFLTVTSATNTGIQSTVPHELRGRVMALYVMSFMGMMPLSALVFGPLGQVIGPDRAVGVGAAVLLAYALFLVARPRLFEMDGHL